MRQWLISEIPTWLLIRLVKRNYWLRVAGHIRDEWYWADLEISRRDITLCPNCFQQIDLIERCPFCYPIILGFENLVGASEWLVTKPESYGYEGEPND